MRPKNKSRQYYDDTSWADNEDDLDDDEIDYWVSQGWDGRGPPPNNLR
jgi:hypothetical protein